MLFLQAMKTYSQLMADKDSEIDSRDAHIKAHEVPNICSSDCFSINSSTKYINLITS